MKITKAAEKLLLDVFVYCEGKGVASGAETDKGTLPLWGQLALAGMVKQMEYRSPLGHPFSYYLTEKGEALIRSKIASVRKTPRFKTIAECIKHYANSTRIPTVDEFLKGLIEADRDKCYTKKFLREKAEKYIEYFREHGR